MLATTTIRNLQKHEDFKIDSDNYPDMELDHARNLSNVSFFSTYGIDQLLLNKIALIKSVIWRKYWLYLGDFWARVFWSTRQGSLGDFWLTQQGVAPAAQAAILPEMGEKSTPADPPEL